ncbi:MAG: serine hydrolase [Planctomycetota bacterium]|jgi:CubicO group peptidase (beta-lactamase class C family)
MKKDKIIAILSVCALLTTARAHAQEESSNPFEGFSEFAERLMSQWAVPGLAVAVVRDGEVVYMSSFGYRDAEERLAVTSKTLFPIGSATKSFTATSIGMLADAGKLDLDTPVIEYMGDFRLYDEHATLHVTPRDLLCHRTGVPPQTSLTLLSPMDRYECYRRLRYLKPTSDLRNVFQYNNLMYTAAGILVERLGGTSWEDFVAERIFEPLGMKRSNFSVTDLQKTDDFAQPYMALDGKPARVPFRNIDSMGPAGSINSNLEDMTKWLLFNLNSGRVGDRQVISEASLAEMHNPQMVIRKSMCGYLEHLELYGMGWFISDYRGHRVIHHGGNVDGFSALVSFMPEEKTGVVALLNSTNFMFFVVERNIYDRLLGLQERDWNTGFKKAYTDILEALAAAHDKGEAIPGTSPSLPLARYAGTYEHRVFDSIEVRNTNDKLTIELPSGLRCELEHFHFDLFKGKTSDFYFPVLQVRFHLDDDGALNSLSMPLQPDGGDVVFKRVENRKSVAASFE